MSFAWVRDEFYKEYQNIVQAATAFTFTKSQFQCHIGSLPLLTYRVPDIHPSCKTRNMGTRSSGT